MKIIRVSESTNESLEEQYGDVAMRLNERTDGFHIQMWNSEPVKHRGRTYERHAYLDGSDGETETYWVRCEW